MVSGHGGHEREADRRAELQIDVCRCGHSATRHPVALDGECKAPGCGCKGLRPRLSVDVAVPSLPRVPVPQPAGHRPLTVPAPPAPAVQPAPKPPAARMPVAELLNAAEDSGSVGLQRKSRQVRVLIAEIRASLVEESVRAERRAEVERLERELAEKRRLLGYVCPECGEAKKSPQGLGSHRQKSHGVLGASRSV